MKIRLSQTIVKIFLKITRKRNLKALFAVKSSTAMQIKSLILPLFLFLSSFCLGQEELEKGKALYQKGNYEGALAAINVWVEESKNPDGYMLRADCLQKLGEYSMSRADYDKARLNGYSDTDLNLNRGICKISLAQYDDARLDLSTYIEKNPNDPKGYYWMATLEYMNVENKACLRYIEEAIALDTNYAAAYYLRGANFIEQGKTNFAIEDFEMAYSLDESLYRAKMNVATIIMDLGQYQNAHEMLMELKVENIDFQDEVLYYLGEVDYRMHDLDGACLNWREASSMGDEDAKLNYKRLCLDKSGKARFKSRNYVQF
jgi:tetratricopeptide (TPR) repeat protein